jgi:hypothetical protein
MIVCWVNGEVIRMNFGGLGLKSSVILGSEIWRVNFEMGSTKILGEMGGKRIYWGLQNVVC